MSLTITNSHNHVGIVHCQHADLSFQFDIYTFTLRYINYQLPCCDCIQIKNKLEFQCRYLKPLKDQDKKQEVTTVYLFEQKFRDLGDYDSPIELVKRLLETHKQAIIWIFENKELKYNDLLLQVISQ
jgi:hypothetical protein